jgi:hypothetical protein
MPSSSLQVNTSLHSKRYQSTGILIIGKIRTHLAASGAPIAMNGSTKLKKKFAYQRIAGITVALGLAMALAQTITCLRKQS